MPPGPNVGTRGRSLEKRSWHISPSKGTDGVHEVVVRALAKQIRVGSQLMDTQVVRPENADADIR